MVEARQVLAVGVLTEAQLGLLATIAAGNGRRIRGMPNFRKEFPAFSDLGARDVRRFATAVLRALKRRKPVDQMRDRPPIYAMRRLGYRAPD